MDLSSEFDIKLKNCSGTRMPRLCLTFIIASFLNSSLMADLQIPTLTLNPLYSVVQPGEVLQFRCITNQTETPSDFTLYKNNSIIKTQSAVEITLTADASSQGLYNCDYIFRSSRSSRSNFINITVVNLQQPDISFRADKGWFHGLWGSHGLEVIKGYAFSINCFTKPQYPGGSFNLLFNGFTKKQTNFNHSAIFQFPEAEFDHQGNYSCTYEVSVSSRNFTSTATELLVITVKASPVPYIAVGLAAGFLLLLVPVIICFVKMQKRQKLQVNSSKKYKRE
ncbi:low affinity immunoglobulin gamma Fc region receptor II-c-like [Silurus meridionalis]|uniref:low affinity immunoglobulin gamma Fc region receptor II-c-like n=1 Tax=Silurus meridionalis TaxID=175797 RepID=UPI001EEB938C|nr:low affinity immunoglobulin gamma Fc region receptor II-c-like [Silurus meridionalis]